MNVDDDNTDELVDETVEGADQNGAVAPSFVDQRANPGAAMQTDEAAATDEIPEELQRRTPEEIQVSGCCEHCCMNTGWE